MTIRDNIETFNLDDSKVHKLALELDNKRMSREEQEAKAELPKLKYLRDFHKRALTGGDLTFMEAKYLVREQLTFDKWRATFYEVAQFPQVVYFYSENQARKFFMRVSRYGKGARGGPLMAQRVELFKPADHIYGERVQAESWKSESYKPDPMQFKGYR